MLELPRQISPYLDIKLSVHHASHPRHLAFRQVNLRRKRIESTSIADHTNPPVEHPPPQHNYITSPQPALHHSSPLNVKITTLARTDHRPPPAIQLPKTKAKPTCHPHDPTNTTIELSTSTFNASYLVPPFNNHERRRETKRR